MTDRGLTVNGVRAVFVRVTVRIRAFVAFAEKYAAASLFALSSGARAGVSAVRDVEIAPNVRLAKARARRRPYRRLDRGRGRARRRAGDDHGGSLHHPVGRPCRNGTRPWRWFAVKGVGSLASGNTRARARAHTRRGSPAHPRGSSNHRARPRGSRLRRARRDPSSFPRQTYPRRRSSRTLPSAIFPGKNICQVLAREQTGCAHLLARTHDDGGDERARRAARLSTRRVARAASVQRLARRPRGHVHERPVRNHER